MEDRFHQIYPELNLYKLRHHVTYFVTKYSFIQSVCLFQSKEGIAHYNLILVIPIVPLEMKGLYYDFKKNMDSSPFNILNLSSIYKQPGDKWRGYDKWMWWEACGKDEEMMADLSEFIITSDPVKLYPTDTESGHLDQSNQDITLKEKKIALSNFDSELLKYAKRFLKKKPFLTIPDIVRFALKNEEDFLYKLNRTSRLPKQETIEKRLRKLLKQQK